MQAARGTSLKPSDHTTPDLTPRRRRRHIMLFAVLAVVAYVTDVVTKTIAVDRLGDGRTVDVVGEYLRLHLTYNPGAAFSLGTSYTVALTVVAIVAALTVLWVARRLASTGWAIGLGFLLGGVGGNLTDRLMRDPGPFRGHVVDFFMLPNFPLFNVADICINIAAASIIIQALRGIRVDGLRHEKPGAPGEAARS